jgi:hypothetical protein
MNGVLNPSGGINLGDPSDQYVPRYIGEELSDIDLRGINSLEAIEAVMRRLDPKVRERVGPKLLERAEEIRQDERRGNRRTGPSLGALLNPGNVTVGGGGGLGSGTSGSTE